ncbi:outer membrane protein assembly factor BamB family protein [Micromonospora sp. LH3U1]|uniref:outer membrane protein assembly factor BamB family protein n=1 Tax=Micromonospora sp. LH3U1 TaxID=3018339 RepID=UPI00234BC34B|nr:PQQ-binding-like beta-propeller repeat protein [Micromonospora sp. LH3U1]WCN82984.1 PQQ-binding-like beta-propeller repeat protein [Micromonospora sp. LH3U1]
MTGPVIDLGELRHGQDPDPLPRPPRANGRQLRCALALLLVLLTLASAAVPQPRRAAVTLPGSAGADVVVLGDLLVVIDATNAQKPQRLAAFRLPGGDPVWQASLPMVARYWGVSPLAGMLLATGYEIGPEGQGTLTVALDLATGAYRWQQPGSANRLADGNMLLQSGDDDEPVSLRAVDPCCGTVRWQLTDAADYVNVRDTDDGVDRLVLNRVDGPTEVRDAITGAVLARADLRPPGGGTLGYVQVVNELLLTVGGVPATVTAYGLDRLDRRWNSPAGQVDFVEDCGPVLCLRTRSNGLWAVDRVTGEARWSSDRWDWVSPHGGRLVASTVNSSGAALQQLAVLDPMTGRVLAELGRWELAQFGLDGPLIGVRRRPDGGLLVAKLDVRAGEVRMLDVLPDATGECQAIVDQLQCRHVDGSFKLWQLPD